MVKKISQDSIKAYQKLFSPPIGMYWNVFTCCLHCTFSFTFVIMICFGSARANFTRDTHHTSTVRFSSIYTNTTFSKHRFFAGKVISPLLKKKFIDLLQPTHTMAVMYCRYHLIDSQCPQCLSDRPQRFTDCNDSILFQRLKHVNNASCILTASQLLHYCEQ